MVASEQYAMVCDIGSIMESCIIEAVTWSRYDIILSKSRNIQAPFLIDALTFGVRFSELST